MNNMPEYSADYSDDDLSYMLNSSPSIDDYPDEYFFLENNFDNPPAPVVEAVIEEKASPTPIVRNKGQQRLYKNDDKVVWVDSKKNQKYDAPKSKKRFKNNNFKHKQPKKTEVAPEAEQDDSLNDEPTLLKSLKKKAEQIQDDSARQAFEQKSVLAQSVLKNILDFAENAPYATDLRKHLDDYLIDDVVDNPNDEKANEAEFEYEYKKTNLPEKPFKIDDYSEPSHHYNLTDKLTYEALLPFMSKAMTAIKSSLIENASKNALDDENAKFAFQIMSQIKVLSEMYEPNADNEADLKEINNTINGVEVATQKPFDDFLKDEKLQTDFANYLNHREFEKSAKAKKEQQPQDEPQDEPSNVQAPQAPVAPQANNEPEKNQILFDVLQRDIEQANQAFHQKSNLQDLQESMNEAKLEQDRANNQDMDVVLDVIKNSSTAKHNMVLNTLKLQNEYLSNPTAKNYQKAERHLNDVEQIMPDAKEYIAKSNDKAIIQERERYIELLQKNQNDTSDLIKFGQSKLLDNSLFDKPKLKAPSTPSTSNKLSIGI